MRYLPFFLFFLSTSLCAQLEILPIGDFLPDNIDFRSSMRGVDFNGQLIFPATTDETGSELWISDGTEVGTQLLVDLVPGPGNSSPQNLFVADSTLYFVASTPALGFELYRSDGTAAGTSLVRDIFPGPESAFSQTVINRFHLWRGTVYFVAQDANLNRELWSTDGTQEGTQLVVDLTPFERASSSPANLTETEHFLYFTANDGLTPEVWRTDGDTTVKVSEIGMPGFAMSPGSLTVLGDYVYFGAGPGNFEYDLYRSLATPESDPTPELIYDFPDQGLKRIGESFGTLNGSLIFPADLALDLNIDLWISDGTTSGTRVLFDTIIENTVDRFIPRTLTLSGNYLFYVDALPDTGAELWRTDGTTRGTILLKDIYEGPFGAIDRGYLHDHLDRLYFAANGTIDGSGETTGMELYTSLGTEKTTYLAADLFPGEQGSSPYHFVSVAEKLFFFAEQETGLQLFVLSGTPPPPPLFTVIDSTSVLACNGDANGMALFTVCGGTPPYTFGGTTNETGQFSISDLAAGFYQFTVTDNGDSSIVVSIDITQPDSLELITTELTGQNSLEGGTIMIMPSGGTPPYRFTWADTSLTVNFRDDLDFGTYYLTVTDENNCITQDSFIVDDLTSVANLSEGEFNVYPTVVTNELYVELTEGISIQRVTFYDLSGQKVSSMAGSGQQHLTLGSSFLPKIRGTYLIYLEASNGRKGVRKVIIQ